MQALFPLFEHLKTDLIGPLERANLVRLEMEADSAWGRSGFSM